MVKQGILLVNRIDHRTFCCNEANQFPLCITKYVGCWNSYGKSEINLVNCQCMQNVNGSDHTQVHTDTISPQLPCLSKHVGL